MSDNDTGWMRAAETRARQFLDKGQIETDKVVLLAEDVLALVGELRKAGSTRRAILVALADDAER